MTARADHLHFDLTALPSAARYKLVTGIVVPRPIAWVSTLDAAGHVNLAPYSFFNIMGSDPPVVAFAPGDRAPGIPKDTARNIPPGGDFTVNLVSRDLAETMTQEDWEVTPPWPHPIHTHRCMLKLKQPSFAAPICPQGDPLQIAFEQWRIQRTGVQRYF